MRKCGRMKNRSGDFHLAPGCANKSLTKAISVFIFLSKLHHNFVFGCIILQKRRGSSDWDSTPPTGGFMLSVTFRCRPRSCNQPNLTYARELDRRNHKLGAQFSDSMWLQLGCNLSNLTDTIELDSQSHLSFNQLEHASKSQWGSIS